jgi:hypothetical protein
MLARKASSEFGLLFDQAVSVSPCGQSLDSLMLAHLLSSFCACLPGIATELCLQLISIVAITRPFTPFAFGRNSAQ